MCARHCEGHLPLAIRKMTQGNRRQPKQFQPSRVIKGHYVPQCLVYIHTPILFENATLVRWLHGLSQIHTSTLILRESLTPPEVPSNPVALLSWAQD